MAVRRFTNGLIFLIRRRFFSRRVGMHRLHRLRRPRSINARSRFFYLSRLVFLMESAISDLGQLSRFRWKRLWKFCAGLTIRFTAFLEKEKSRSRPWKSGLRLWKFLHPMEVERFWRKRFLSRERRNSELDCVRRWSFLFR